MQALFPNLAASTSSSGRLSHSIVVACENFDTKNVFGYEIKMGVKFYERVPFIKLLLFG